MKKWLTKEGALEVLIRYRSETEFAPNSNLETLEDGLEAIIESHRWLYQQLSLIGNYMEYLESIGGIDTSFNKDGILDVSKLIDVVERGINQGSAVQELLISNKLKDKYNDLLKDLNDSK